MTDPTSIADRTWRSAIQQWEGGGCRGPRPTLADYDHLSASPDTIPAPSAAPAVRTGGDAVPEPLDTETAAKVTESLKQMSAANGFRSSVETQRGISK